ncbi:acetyl-CoA carboxylase biotin carboxyl carrier protein [Nonomuraea harbinensis]|uniref:Acetyl-CoA carboxylase biotin carboxyl carrier protein n=1 Tax=Nonomuraea harbinensis TaxID=1286938 RepID=A0ABW1CAK3_9ACTN|nr:biotin/lipoyl-containing protein [Nonomuraea harbinensis]
MQFDPEDLALVLESLDGVDYQHFQLEMGDLRIVLTRGPETPASPAPSASGPAPDTAGSRPESKPAADIQPGTPHPTAAASTTAERPGAPGPDDKTITAPILGTFYRSPKPGDPPYVSVGDPVETDTVICIVEVMKLMTPVTAGHRGVVTEVLATDGELVEFEQPLFRIGPAS